MRTVSLDPGLLTHEELLAEHTGQQRRTLEKIIAKSTVLQSREKRIAETLSQTRIKAHWILDGAKIKVSVSILYLREVAFRNGQT